MSDEKPPIIEPYKGVTLYFAQPAPAPVIDTAKVRHILTESMFLRDNSGMEAVFSMLRALLDEHERLVARVEALERR